jgi:hypothetical protein
MQKVARAVVVAGLALVVATGVADARKPEDVYAGKIVFMRNRLPEHFRSAEDFISQVKRSSMGTLWPEKQGGDKGKWKFEYMAFFARPLDDLECQVRFYDVTGGGRQLVSSGSVFMHRGDRMFGSNWTIGAPEFEPNKRILMTLENRGRVLAAGSLIIRGEGPHFSGKVEFTDEEARVKDPGR